MKGPNFKHQFIRFNSSALRTRLSLWIRWLMRESERFLLAGQFIRLTFGKLDRINPHANELAAVSRDNNWPLRDSLADWRGRNGGSLPRARHATGSHSGLEDFARGRCRRSDSAAAVYTGSQIRVRFKSSKHPTRLRDWASRNRTLHCY